MQVNNSQATKLGKPCWRDMAQLTKSDGLLPANVVPLLSLKQLKRSIREINLTHPRYQEETPLVLAHEVKRRERLSGKLKVSVTPSQVA